jgi:hypothetical protein
MEERKLLKIDHCCGIYVSTDDCVLESGFRLGDFGSKYCAK